MQNCPQFVIMFYAIQRIGGIVVPFSPMFKEWDLEFEINEVKSKQAAQKRREELEKQAAKDTAAKFESIVVKLYAKGGNDGKFFGSVTSKEIAEALEAQFGIAIDKRKIVLPDALKAFGTYSIDVKLYPEIVGKLNVLIANKE